MTKPDSVHSAISSASAMPSQRWIRKVMRRAQRVARVKREKRGAARDAGERPAPVLEREAVGGMQGDGCTKIPRRIGTAVGIAPDADDARGVVGVERVLQPHSEAVMLGLVGEDP